MSASAARISTSLPLPVVQQNGQLFLSPKPREGLALDLWPRVNPRAAGVPQSNREQRESEGSELTFISPLSAEHDANGGRRAVHCEGGEVSWELGVVRGENES